MKKKTTGTTYYCLILDESGSMSGFRNQVKKLYLQKIREFKNSADNYNQNVIGGLVTFNDNVDMKCWLCSLDTLMEPQQIDNYNPQKSTALLDAIGFVINKLQKYTLSENDAVFIEVITDGYENQSQNYNWFDINKLLQKVHSTNKWTVVLQVPPGHKQRLLNNLLLSHDNVREWEQTQVGFADTVAVTTQALNSYMQCRSLGHTHTQQFYADINLDKLSTKDVKQNLNDLSQHFKILKVDKEYNVADFVKEKLKKDLVVGTVYYQLTKPELLRKGRQLLIMEKNKNSIWGGEEAYHLLNLPQNGNVQLNPGNLSNYDIFVESRSNNRKLVRGTKVLFDKTKKLGETPTWQV